LQRESRALGPVEFRKDARSRTLQWARVQLFLLRFPLHRKILDHPDFVAGRLDTGVLARTGLAIGDKK